MLLSKVADWRDSRPDWNEFNWIQFNWTALQCIPTRCSLGWRRCDAIYRCTTCARADKSSFHHTGCPI